MAVPFVVALIEWELDERVYRLHRDAFLLSEDAFRRQYRLTKELVRWLCERLQGELTRVRRNTATSLTVELQVLCALRFFATGSFQGMVATDEHLATSQSSVSRCIRAVAQAIVDCLGEEWIAFPSTRAAVAATKAAFARLDDRFDGCVGCVDGTLIAIQAPSSNDPDINKAAYFCRKGFYALNVMVVCDAEKRITALDPTFPGSVHDSFVWKASSLHEEFVGGRLVRPGEYLLGDSGYPLQPWLVTPVPGDHAARTPAARFNTAHASVRSVVERCIGLLKARFRCLQRYRTLHYAPTTASTIVAACAVLHNLCLHYDCPEPDTTGDDEEGTNDEGSTDDEESNDDEERGGPEGMARRGREQREQLLCRFCCSRNSS